MKKLKIQILLITMLLGNGLSIQGMQSVYSRGAQAARRRMPTRPTQSWRSWLKSKFTSSQPSVSAQGRGYGTTPAQQAQKTSFWNTFKSYFQQKPLTPQESLIECYKLIVGHWVQHWKAPNGRMFDDKWIFDDADFEAVKKFIESNTNFINEQLVSIPLGLPRPTNLLFSNGTILDKVFALILAGDYGNFRRIGEYQPSDDIMKLLKLARYLIDKGAVINQENASSYINEYITSLMPAYRNLYGPNPSTRYGVEYELQKLKEIFKELDLILERLMPGLSNEVKVAQKERAEIEANPEVYRKKVEDQVNRAQYMQLKVEEQLKAEEEEYRRQKGGYTYYSPPTYSGMSAEEFAKKVRFDKEEYEAWLKSGKNRDFFSEQRAGFKRGSSRFEDFFGGQKKTSQYEGVSIQALLNLPANASLTDIKKAYRNYSMENHPDRLPKDMSEKERMQRIEKYKEVNVAWDAYNEELKQQQATE